MKHFLSCLKGDTIKAIFLVCLAVGGVGMSYGSLAMAYGFPLWVPFVLSITVLAEDQNEAEVLPSRSSTSAASAPAAVPVGK